MAEVVSAPAAPAAVVATVDLPYMKACKPAWPYDARDDGWVKARAQPQVAWHRLRRRRQRRTRARVRRRDRFNCRLTSRGPAAQAHDALRADLADLRAAVAALEAQATSAGDAWRPTPFQASPNERRSRIAPEPPCPLI